MATILATCRCVWSVHMFWWCTGEALASQTLLFCIAHLGLPTVFLIFSLVLRIELVYVIAWFAVVFGNNSTHNAVNCTRRINLKALIFTMFNIKKISCIQGSVTEWIINVYMSTTWIYKCCSLVLFIVRVVPRFLLGCTAHMNHIEAHIESFHRIVQVDLAVFTFTFLCSQAFAAKLACAKDGWSSPNCSRMGGA